MLERTLFNEEHLLFRDAFEKFLDAEVVPRYPEFEKNKCVDREVWRKAGRNGFLCHSVEEKYGGLGLDFVYSAIMIEACARKRVVGFSLPLHNDIVCPYLTRFANEEQKRRWLPGVISGDTVMAIAMTEPQAGSDLAGIKTTAARVGDHYVVNGQKTFITNGQLCDLCIVAVKTDPRAEPGHKGISLLVVEDGTPGFSKGANLDKIGQHASDTSELWFQDCRVPAANLLGEENRGFYMLMENLQQERLVSAVRATAEAEWTIDETTRYVKERKAFGQPLSKIQNIQFKLAEAATQAAMTRVFVDRLIAEHAAGREIVTETMMAKWWATDLNFRIANECLQMFGGYGYMTEYPISRAFLDFRVEMIYAGSNEIMKTIIAKRMGL